MCAIREGAQQAMAGRIYHCGDIPGGICFLCGLADLLWSRGVEPEQDYRMGL